MKVFISWSGERSHAVALSLKNFIGDIIQSVTPFVSDEDITSGERWNVRIKEELQENQYGILSITSDNKEAPWLLFEAGALSNSTHNIPVVPFLFDVEPSEMTGSPLLQFQAAFYYKKEHVWKLVSDINDACGENKLDSDRLKRAFDRCYDEFESALKEAVPESNEPKEAEFDKTHAILEELLDLTRGNQKLLSSESQGAGINSKIEQLVDRLERQTRKGGNRLYWFDIRTFHPIILEELLFFRDSRHGLLIVLSLLREDLPWIYVAGKDLLDAIKSNAPQKTIKLLISEFEELVDFTCHHPMFSLEGEKNLYMLVRELSKAMLKYVERQRDSRDSRRNLTKSPTLDE